MRTPTESLDLNRLSDAKFILAVLLSAFIMKIAWILLVQPVPVCDFSFYFKEAALIAGGKGYVAPGGKLTAFWPVGYPGFLALLFYVFRPSVFVASFANVALSVGTLFFFYKFAALISENKVVTRLATIVVLFMPSQTAYCSLVSDTVLFQFLFYAGLVSLMKARSFPAYLSAGAVFGLAAYVRPYAIPVPFIVLFVCMCCHQIKGFWKSAIPVGLGIVLILMPWTIRNYQVFHGFVPVSNNGGFNMLIGNSELSSGRYNNPDIDLSRYDNEFELDRDAMRKAAGYIADHPVKALSKTVLKLYYMFNDDTTALWWNLAGYRFASGGVPAKRFEDRDLPVIIIFQGYYFFLLAGAAAFMIARFVFRCNVSDVENIGVYLIFYFALISMIFFGDSRFRFPVNPIIALYAVAFICSVSGYVKHILKFF